MARDDRHRLRLVFVSCAFAAALAPARARAACSPFESGDFGQIDANCGGNYCYVVSPGTNSSSSIAGSFWAFAHGVPAVGAGADNGSWSDDAWAPASGPGVYLGGTWAASTSIDGCIAGQVAPGKPAEIMVVALSDQNAAGTFGYFAIAAARRFQIATPQFDFTFVAGGGIARNIDLVLIPRARAISSTRTTITFQGPFLADVSAGFYADASLDAGEAIVGYRLYTRTTASTDRRRANGWAAATPPLPLGQQVTIPYTCTTGSNYYATALVYDSGFESDHLSNDTRLICGNPDLDGDGYPGFAECAPSCPWDCDDTNPNVHPGALEVCNGIDDDCDSFIDNAALPAAAATLRVDRVPGAARLTWTADPVATRFDVVSGKLLTLRDTGGDYAAATSACLASDLALTTVDDDAPIGPDDDGVWYLLRGENCTGSGTYDDPFAAQANPRDPGIAASGQACP